MYFLIKQELQFLFVFISILLLVLHSLPLLAQRCSHTVFFGNPYSEYARMYPLLNLESRHPRTSILDCPGGTSTFTKHARKLGFQAVSADIQYSNRKSFLVDLSAKCFEEVVRYGKYPLSRPVAEFRASRADFFSDYLIRIRNREYIFAALPDLPFDESSFDIVLSGHLLFMYPSTPNLSYLRELLRVTKHELHIYPLGGYDPNPQAAGTKSNQYQDVFDAISKEHPLLQIALYNTSYPFHEFGAVVTKSSSRVSHAKRKDMTNGGVKEIWELYQTVVPNR